MRIKLDVTFDNLNVSDLIHLITNMNIDFINTTSILQRLLIINEYSNINFLNKNSSFKDETLFKGIASDETALMVSLENQMK